MSIRDHFLEEHGPYEVELSERSTEGSGAHEQSDAVLPQLLLVLRIASFEFSLIFIDLGFFEAR